jgi:hypothetical protein
LPKSVVGEDPRSAWSDDNHLPGEQLDELAGRVDYFSFSDERRRPGGVAAYFDRIVGERHLNVVEIGHWNFTVQCSIGVAAEVLRYRTMERSQASSQVHPYDEVPEVRVPWYHYPPIRSVSGTPNGGELYQGLRHWEQQGRNAWGTRAPTCGSSPGRWPGATSRGRRPPGWC